MDSSSPLPACKWSAFRVPFDTLATSGCSATCFESWPLALEWNMFSGIRNSCNQRNETPNWTPSCQDGKCFSLCTLWPPAHAMKDSIDVLHKGPNRTQIRGTNIMDPLWRLDRIKRFRSRGYVKKLPIAKPNQKKRRRTAASTLAWKPFALSYLPTVPPCVWDVTCRLLRSCCAPSWHTLRESCNPQVQILHSTRSQVRGSQKDQAGIFAHLLVHANSAWDWREGRCHSAWDTRRASKTSPFAFIRRLEATTHLACITRDQAALHKPH